jgi:hypothetical protein
MESVSTKHVERLCARQVLRRDCAPRGLSLTPDCGQIHHPGRDAAGRTKPWQRPIPHWRSPEKRCCALNRRRDLQIGFDRTLGNNILRVGGVLGQTLFNLGYFLGFEWLPCRLKGYAVPQVFSQLYALSRA